MLSRRRLLQASSVSALGALGLASCQSTETPAAGPVELRVALFSSNKNHLEVLNGIASDYVAKYPDRVSKVVFDTLPAANYITVLQTQIAGGQSPDLAWVFETNARQFVDGGAFADVTDVLTATPDYDLADVVPQAISIWQREGRTYAYPFSSSPYGVYVNLDLLDQAGEPSPRERLQGGAWTWEAIAASAAAVTSKVNGVAGLITAGDPFGLWFDALGPMWPQWGAAAWSADGTACQLTSPEMTSFFRWFHEQVTVGAHPKPGELFEVNAGKVAYKVAQMSAAAGIAEGGFKWDFLPLPAGPAGTQPIVGQSAIGVLSQSKNITRSAEFLAWFTSKESGAKLSRFFPQPRRSLLSVEVIKQAAPLLSQESIQQTVVDQALSGKTKEGHKNLARISDKVKVHLDAFWRGSTSDPADALGKACADIQADLA